MLESGLTYESTSVQELYPQGNSHIYYQSVAGDNFFGRYLDNEIYADSPITEIVWYVERDCLRMSGVIEAAVAANLTIAGSCIELIDVEFRNIWVVMLLEYVSIEGNIINYNRLSNANITINGIGTRDNPIYGLSAVGNINLQGTNQIIDLNVSGERFVQEGSALIPRSFRVNSSVISFSNTSLLEVGEYYLRGKEIFYEGILDAKRGDLTIEYLNKDLNQDLDIYANLRAAGTVTIYSDKTLNNHGQIVGNDLQVISPSFNNYGIVNINHKSEFVLTNDFANSALGYVKTEEYYVGSKQAVNGKIQKFINKGKIKIGYGEIHAVEIQLVASGFQKTDFVSAGNTRGGNSKGKDYFACNFYQENIHGDHYPIPSILDTTQDLHLDTNILKTTSSKISVDGKIFLYDTVINHEDFKLYKWGKCDYGGRVGDFFNSGKSQAVRSLSGYGSVSYSGYHNFFGYAHESVTTESNPAIKQSYNSRIYAKEGIEGDVRGILNVEMSWQETTKDLIGNGKDLVLYDSSSSSALTEIIETQRLIYAKFMHSFIEMNAKTELNIIPFSNQPILSNIFTFNDKISLIPGTIEFLITKRNDLLEYENSKDALAISSNNYFDEYILFLSNWAKKNQLSLRLLGDESYLNQLLEDQIFTNIGYITGMNNANLIQELIANTINIKDGEFWQSLKRGEPFKVGESLTESQISRLQKPITWFVKQEDCLKSGYNCLIPKVYFTQENLKDFIWEAGMISDSNVRLNVIGDVLLDKITSINAQEIELNVQGNVINFGTIKGDEIKISGTGGVFLDQVIAGESFSLKAVNAILSNQIKSGGDITLEIAQNLAIATIVTIHNYGSNIISKIEQETSINASGKITLIGEKIGVKGARIIGSDVYLKAQDKILIIPVELYFETVRYGKKFYQKYQEMRMHESFILARGTSQEAGINISATSEVYEVIPKTTTAPSGSIVIEAGNDIGIKGGKYHASDSINFISADGGLVMEAATSWQKLEEETKKNKWFSRKITTKTAHHETPSLIVLDAPNLNIETKDSQTLIGVKIVAKTTKLIAGSSEHSASIAILPAHKISELEIRTKSKGFSFKFENRGITFLQKKYEARGEAHIQPVPSLLQIENEFYVYASGKYIHVQPMFIPDEDSQGKMKGIINAQDIALESAPSIHTEYSYLNKMGNGIGFSSKKGEYAIKAAVAIETNKHSHTKIIHEIPRIFGGFLTFNASHSIYDQGILIHAQELHMNSKIEVHGISVDIETESHSQKLLETGLKLGIKSSFSNLVDTGEEIISENYKTPEGVISSAFRAWKLYTGVLRFLSGGGIKAGGWFYLEGGKSKETVNINQANPTEIIVEKLNITTEQFVLKGTQIHAVNVTIKAIEMDAIAADNTYNYDKIKQGLNTEISLIPLSTSSIIPSLNIAFGKDKIKQEQKLNVKIHVSNRLTLDIETTANMKGINIQARELFATFGDLILESLQDILEIQGKGINLGIGLNIFPDTIGARLRNGKKHVVESLSSIIGIKSTNIVVANALMLNGAMIANAERDGEGRYTDHGNFVLKMGELFVKHIHDYDNGYTLQAAVNFATATSFLDKTGKNLPFESLESTLALNRGEGWSLATIGKGAIECTKQGSICEIDKANRDVNNAQKFEKEIDIKPIFLFYTNLRPSDFKNLPKNPRQFLENIFNNIAKDLGFNPSQQDSNQFPDTEDQQTSQDQSYKTSKQLQQELTEINEEISDYDLTTRYLDNPVRKLAVILAIWDIQKIDPEVTTAEAFAAAFPAIIKAEQQAPMQRWNVALVVDDLMLIGGALALLALTPYALKLGDELNDIYQKYILYKKQSGDNVKDIPKAKYKDQTTTASNFPDPDEDPDKDDQKVWEKNPTKSESKIWKKLKPYRGKTRTNGLRGNKRKFYEWDHTHNDIEVYDNDGIHLGSKNPRTGEMYKPPKPGRTIEI